MYAMFINTTALGQLLSWRKLLQLLSAEITLFWICKCPSVLQGKSQHRNVMRRRNLWWHCVKTCLPGAHLSAYWASTSALLWFGYSYPVGPALSGYCVVSISAADDLSSA